MNLNETITAAFQLQCRQLMLIIRRRKITVTESLMRKLVLDSTQETPEMYLGDLASQSGGGYMQGA